MGKCVFNPVWVKNKDYQSWIAPAEDKYRFFCRVCNCSLDIGKIGEKAVKLHHGSGRHKKRLAESVVPINSFLQVEETQTPLEQPPSQPAERFQSSSSSSSSTSFSSSSGIASFCVNQTDILKAEILYTLKVVDSHYSFRSCEGNSLLFKNMFHDSKIARGFACNETKSGYIAKFGIAPHFVSVLKKKVRDESGYVLLFDESLNKERQEKQMDIHIRTWEGQHVVTSFLTSEFLGHAFMH